MAKVKGSISRKEARKAHKLAAKEKKQKRHAQRAVQTDANGVSKESNNSAKREVVSKVAAKGVKTKTNGKGSERRKRWRAEEIDPMIAAEDAELKRLERLLGISGPNADKKRVKLSRELEVEDGLGDEFGAFLSDLDRISEVVGEEAEEAIDGTLSDDGQRGHKADWDFHQNISEGSSESDAGGREQDDDDKMVAGAVAPPPRRHRQNEKGYEGDDHGVGRGPKVQGEREYDPQIRFDKKAVTRGTPSATKKDGRDSKKRENGRAGVGNERVGDDDTMLSETIVQRKEGRSPEMMLVRGGDGGDGSEEEVGSTDELEHDDNECEEEEQGSSDAAEEEEEEREEQHGERRKRTKKGAMGGHVDADEEEGIETSGQEAMEEFPPKIQAETRDDDRSGSEESAGADGDGDDDTVGGEKESEEFLKHVYRPRPGQDIYGRSIGGGNESAAPTKYVPPHLRAAAAAAAAATRRGGAGTGAAATSPAGDMVVDKLGAVKSAQVQRVVNGITNRLSEETLEPVTARLKDAYRENSTTEVNEALWQATRAVCVHEKHVMTTLIPPFAAVIAALNISLGADVGGFFLETIAKELNEELIAGATPPVDVRRENSSARAGRPRRRGTGSNLMLLLAYLYNYGVAHCTLIYDIVRLLVDAFGDNDMELLLLLLRHSGFQLRSDDAQALKQIVSIVKDKAQAATAVAGGTASIRTVADSNTATINQSSAMVSSEVPLSADASALSEETGRWKAAFGVSSAPGSKLQSVSGKGQQNRSSDDDGTVIPAAGSGSRARYILDTILELQSNKRSRLQEQGQESGRRVRKWLGAIKSARGGVGVGRSKSSIATGGGGGGTTSDTSLRVTWAELVSTESKGRWWRVGAAWVGRAATDRNGELEQGQRVTGGSRESNGGGGGIIGGDAIEYGGGTVGGEGGQEVGLMELAARQRMNTDVRRSVFVAIVGSSDCEDALEKILKLNLKGAQEREIARVIVECCCQEASYNPFYAHLAERACDRQPQLRFTFQVAFWDALKTLEDGAARRAASLARLMAHLVIRKQMSLIVLKSVEIPELSPSGLILMRVFFHEIISAGDDRSFMEVFRRLARAPGKKDAGGQSAARDNILVFLRGHLGPAPKSWNSERRKAFRKRVKGACRLIDAMVTAEELG